MKLLKKHKEQNLRKKYKNLDEKYMGFEPELTETPSVSDIEAALRWYSHFHDFKSSLKFVGEFYKKNKVNQSNLKKINTTDILDVGRVVGFLCRMRTRGVEVLPPKYNNVIIEKLKLIEQIGKTRKEKVVLEDKKIISVQQRIKEKADSIFFDLEYIEELFIDNNFETTFEFKNFQKITKIKKPIAKILSHLSQLKIDELENKNNDPDLKEAFCHLKKREKNKIIKFWKSIKEGCDDIS